MLALLAAMNQEVAPLRQGMTVLKRVSDRGCTIYEGAYRGRDILLVRTGVGKRRAQRSAGHVLERYGVGAVVSFGFAGALGGSARCGDVVVCDALYCGDGPGEPDKGSSECFRPDAFLAELAARAPVGNDFNVLRGTGVSVSRVVCEPEEKRSLGKAFLAGAVDMESYWIAEIAAERGTPFLTVRAISDSADDALPPFDRFMDSNGWRWSKALPFFTTHPQQLLRLWRLRAGMRQPARNMKSVLDWVVDNVRV